MAIPNREALDKLVADAFMRLQENPTWGFASCVPDASVHWNKIMNVGDPHAYRNGAYSGNVIDSTCVDLDKVPKRLEDKKNPAA